MSLAKCERGHSDLGSGIKQRKPGYLDEPLRVVVQGEYEAKTIYGVVSEPCC